jgi:hypothetical protein
MKTEDIHILKEKQQRAAFACTSPIINQAWQTQYAHIPYCIPDLMPSVDVKRKKQCVVIGQFLPENHIELQQLFSTSEIPIIIIGDNPGISKSRPPHETVKILQESRYYLNLAQHVTMPLNMLVAMSCGCIPISNTTPFTTDLITHQETGLLYDSIENSINILNGTSLYCKEMPVVVNKLIKERYGHNKWDAFLQSFEKFIYAR